MQALKASSSIRVEESATRADDPREPYCEDYRECDQGRLLPREIEILRKRRPTDRFAKQLASTLPEQNRALDDPVLALRNLACASVKAIDELNINFTIVEHYK
ncbi:hypothetical protein [Cupriavidus sp. UYPR2.512]|uniref:hypothetical protein n=1 Tax=Cupriavidus sp. UYPR2.512 TaxID=1080187 RepID=UPI0012F7EEF7|nr:hypothetical protein [Cupriavidus sp. UYPR2.512]UIF88180.1 hypothetical protein KAF44_20210 [Cupriavidus necator]